MSPGHGTKARLRPSDLPSQEGALSHGQSAGRQGTVSSGTTSPRGRAWEWTAASSGRAGGTRPDVWGTSTGRRGCRRMRSPKLAFKERRKPAPKGQEEASETQTTGAGLVPGPRKELPQLGTKRTRSSAERWAKGASERKPALPRRTLGKLRLWVEPVPHRWRPKTCGRSNLEPSPGLKDAVGVGGWRGPGHRGREGDAAAKASAQMGRRASEVCWGHGRGARKGSGLRPGALGSERGRCPGGTVPQRAVAPTTRAS